MWKSAIYLTRTCIIMRFIKKLLSKEVFIKLCISKYLFIILTKIMIFYTYTKLEKLVFYYPVSQLEYHKTD